MTERSLRSRAARSSSNIEKDSLANQSPLELPNFAFRKARKTNKGDSAIPALPKAPEMPVKPYIRYSREVWYQVKAEHPHLMMWEMGRVIGEMWRALPETVRNQYFEDYEARKMLYKEAMKNYYTSPAYLAWRAAKAKEADDQLLEAQTKSQQHIETSHNEDEVIAGAEKIFVQELSPLKNTHEEEFKVFVDPLEIKEEQNASADEEELYIRVKQEVPDSCEDADSADVTPAVSLDRLKSLLASQLKTSPSRGSCSTTAEAPSAAQESNDPLSGMVSRGSRGSLFRCDHCMSYFTKERLATHLYKEICQNFYYCKLCSRKFGTRALYALHLCISNKKLPLYDSANEYSEEHVSVCTICGEQFLDNRKLVSHLMNHRVKCDADVQPAKSRAKEKPTTNFSRHKPETSKLCLKRRHPCDP